MVFILIYRVLFQQDQQSCKLEKNFTDSETQTNFCDGDESRNEIIKTWNTAPEEGNTNFIEQIKEVAELAVQQTGFVYEETSGLYYDYNTGYYYDAVSILVFLLNKYLKNIFYFVDQQKLFGNANFFN